MSALVYDKWSYSQNYSLAIVLINKSLLNNLEVYDAIAYPLYTSF